MVTFVEWRVYPSDIVLTGSWRAKEASFFLVPAVVSSDIDEQSRSYFENMRNTIIEEIKSFSKSLIDSAYIDPVLSATAIAAAFSISDYLDRKDDFANIVKVILDSTSQLVKIQGIAAINRTFRHPIFY